MEKLTEINTLRVRKTRIFLTYFIRLRFQWYSCKLELPFLHGSSLAITLLVSLTAEEKTIITSRFSGFEDL